MGLNVAGAAITAAAILLILPDSGEAGCSKPTTLNNVLFRGREKSRYDDYEIVKFTCKRAFEHQSGDEAIICNGNKWIPMLGEDSREYVPFNCRPMTCTHPPIENGDADVDGNQIRYFCNRGFSLKGRSRSECRLNKAGVYGPADKAPECQPLPTCIDPSSEGLIHSGDCCFTGDTVSASCPPNYRKTEGNPNITCLPFGNWSSSFPRCERIFRCPHPGNSSSSTINGKCCEAGDTLQYKCDPGYELVDPRAGNTITCLKTETWSAPRPRCKEKGSIICPDIPTEENELVIEGSTPDVFYYGDQVNLQCRKGFTTQDTTLSLMCDEDGEWDAKIPVCTPVNPCLRPTQPRNGFIREVIGYKRHYYPIGFEINIECKPGHEIRSGNYGTRCIGDNQWENGISDCTPIECADPGIPEGAQRMGADFRVGHSVTYSCGGGLKLYGSETRTCQENRRWSGTTTVCSRGNTYCPDPGIPMHSQRKGNDFSLGAIVTYKCLDGRVMIGNDTRECQDDKTWSNEEVICLGQNEYSNVDAVSRALSGTMVQIARESIHSKAMLGRSSGMRKAAGSSNGVNIFFLLDASGSIMEVQFNQSTELVKLVIRQIGISTADNGVRVIVITFSHKAKTVVPYTQGVMEEAIKAINGIKKADDEATNIDNAMDHFIYEMSVIKEYKKTRDAKNVAFILTDGLETEGGLSTQKAEMLRGKYGVDMVAIAIGNKRNWKTLKLITGDEKKILTFDSHKKLYNIITDAIGDRVDFGACGLMQPKFSKPGKKLDETAPEGKQRRRRRRSFLRLGRIVGGEESKFAWPWMAALYYKDSTADNKWKFQCGGSIIQREWILSAAHCFTAADRTGTAIDEDRTKNLRIVNDWKVSVGRIVLTDKNSGMDYFVSEIHVAETFEYAPVYLKDDIALLKLRIPIIYDLYTRPICLAPSLNAKLYESGETAMVIGWGHTERVLPGETTTHTDHLNQLSLPLQNDTICQKPEYHVLRRQPAVTSLCAGTGKGGKDSCKGDSGGPLMRLVKTNSTGGVMLRWVEIGFVSWGLGCAQPNHYGYYAHVAKLRPWILNKTAPAELETVTLVD